MTEEGVGGEEYSDILDAEMDIRDVVDAICEEREDSKVRREVAIDAAEAAGIDRDEASRFMNEFISTTEIVELDDGYVQTRRHFDEKFE